MLEKAEQKGVKILLPVDCLMIKDFPDPIDSPVDPVVCPVERMQEDLMGVDIGPKTAEIFSNALKDAINHLRDKLKNKYWNEIIYSMIEDNLY